MENKMEAELLAIAGQMAASALLADFNNDDDALLKHHILVMVRVVNWSPGGIGPHPWVVQEHKQLLLDRLSREAGRLVFCYEVHNGARNPGNHSPTCRSKI